MSRFEYAIYVSMEAPQAFRLEAASNLSGPWISVFKTANATNDGCISRAGVTHGVWTNAELQEAMSTCHGNFSDNPGCQVVAITLFDLRTTESEPM